MPRLDLTTPSPERTRRRTAAHAREAARLHGLSDRWLGEAVLRLARQVRSAVPAIAVRTPDGTTMEGRLLWDAIPEMARRLGCAVDINEAGGGIRGASAWDLRLAVGHLLWGASRAHLADAARPDADLCPVDLLLRDPADGSPVAMLLDRVAPPAPDADDRCARHVREASCARGLAPRETWDPAMTSWARSGTRRPEPESEEAPAPSP